MIFMKYTKSIQLSLIIVLGLTLSMSAQNPTFQWSEHFSENSVGMLNPVVCLASSNGFVVQSVERKPSTTFDKDIYFTTFNSNCESIGKTKLELPKLKGRQAIYLKTLETDNSLIVCSYLPLKANKNTLFAQVYNPTLGTVTEPKKLVSFPVEKTSNSGDFLINISADKQTIGVITHLPYEKKGKEKIQYYTFDSSLNVLANKELVLAYKSEKAYKEVLYITNTKEALLIKSIDKNKSSYKTEILGITTSGLSYTSSIPTESFYVITHKIVATTKGVFMVGFATDVWKKTVATDIKSKMAFIYDIKNQKMLAKHAWSKEMLKNFLGKGFTNLTIKDVLLEGDNLYLVGDRYKVEETLIPGKSFEYDYKYYNGPGVVVKFDLEGNLIYESFYSYSQWFANSWQEIGSFTPVLVNDTLHIYRSIDMSTLSKKWITVGHQAYTMNQTIFTDQEGLQNAIPIMDSKVGGKESSINFCPKTIVKASNSTFYMKAFGTGFQAFGKMTIK